MRQMISRLLVGGGIGGLVSSVALASDGDGSPAGLAKMGAAIGAGLAIGLATFGAATGQGKASAEALGGIARNPSSRADVFTPLVLCLAFMEVQALFGFGIAYLIK